MVKKIFIVILCFLMCFGFALFPMAASQKTCHVPVFKSGDNYNLNGIEFKVDSFLCNSLFPFFNISGSKTLFSNLPAYFSVSDWSGFNLILLNSSNVGFMGFKIANKNLLLSENKYFAISFNVKHSFDDDYFNISPFVCSNNLYGPPSAGNWYRCIGSKSITPTKNMSTYLITFDLSELIDESSNVLSFGWSIRLKNSHGNTLLNNATLEYENIQIHVSDVVPKVPGDISNVADNIKDVSGWLWSKFTALIKMIGDNDLLLWSVSFAIVSGTVYLAIRVVRKFGIKGRR